MAAASSAISSRSSLRTFLSTARRHLQLVQSQSGTAKSSTGSDAPNITFILGNPSADLDSIGSSLLYAYFYPGSARSPAIPLLNIPRRDLRLRPELHALLPHANIEASQLVTLDEIGFGDPPDPALQPDPEQTQIILVDHNALTPPLYPKYKDRIIGCIDHHIDERSLPSSVSPRIITTSGSCTSLVLKHTLTQWNGLSSSATSTNSAGGQVDTASGVDDAAVRRTWDGQLARLALAPVIVDTSNLESPQTRDVDREAVKYLDTKIALQPRLGSTFDRKDYFKLLTEAKRDVSGMTVGDLLARDYKEWEARGKKLGISSVVQGIESLSLKAEQENSKLKVILTGFKDRRSLDVLVVMTKDNDRKTGAFRRELVLCSSTTDVETTNSLVAFEEQAYEVLDLKPLLESEAAQTADSTDDIVVKMWSQGKLDKTRKQVAPLLRNAMEIDAPC